MEEALIAYKNVEIHQQELCVLSGVNFDFCAGELLLQVFRELPCSEGTEGFRMVFMINLKDNIWKIWT